MFSSTCDLVLPYADAMRRECAAVQVMRGHNLELSDTLLGLFEVVQVHVSRQVVTPVMFFVPRSRRRQEESLEGNDL